MMDYEQKTEQANLLVPLEKYLEAGVHIGSKFRSGDMNKFVYKQREDGLCVLDIASLNNRILTAAKFLAQYEPKDVLIVAGRTYAQRAAKKLAEMIGAGFIIGRFIPGTLTNPKNENFIEPKVVFTSDPPVDRQAIKEAIKAKIPVVSLCDTSNLTRNIDLIVPANNKGKKALALIFWLITREILKERGIIKSDSEYTTSVDDFEAKVTRERKEEMEVQEEKPRRDMRGRGRGDRRDDRERRPRGRF